MLVDETAVNARDEPCPKIFFARPDTRHRCTCRGPVARTNIPDLSECGQPMFGKSGTVPGSMCSSRGLVPLFQLDICCILACGCPFSEGRVIHRSTSQDYDLLYSTEGSRGISRTRTSIRSSTSLRKSCRRTMSARKLTTAVASSWESVVW